MNSHTVDTFRTPNDGIPTRNSVDFFLLSKRKLECLLLLSVQQLCYKTIHNNSNTTTNNIPRALFILARVLIMPYRVIRTVQRLSSAHARGMEWWSGRTTMGELVSTSRSTSTPTQQTEQQFTKLLIAVTLSAGTAGYWFMGYLNRCDQEYRRLKRERNQLEARMQVTPLSFGNTNTTHPQQFLVE